MLKNFKKFFGVFLVLFLLVPTVSVSYADEGDGQSQPPSSSEQDNGQSSDDSNPQDNQSNSNDDQNTDNEDDSDQNTGNEEPEQEELPPDQLASTHLHSGKQCVIDDKTYSLGSWLLSSGEVTYSLKPISETKYESDEWPDKILQGNSSSLNSTTYNQIAWVIQSNTDDATKALAILSLEGNSSGVVNSCVDQVSSKNNLSNLINSAKANAGPFKISHNDLSNLPVNTDENLVLTVTNSNGSPMKNFPLEYKEDKAENTEDNDYISKSTNDSGKIEIPFNTELEPNRNFLVIFQQVYPTLKSFGTTPITVAVDIGAATANNNPIEQKITATTNMNPKINIKGSLSDKELLNGDSVKSSIELTNTFNHSGKGTIILLGPVVSKDLTCKTIDAKEFTKAFAEESFEFKGDGKLPSELFEDLPKGCYHLSVEGSLTDIPEDFEKVSFKDNSIDSVYVYEFTPKINVILPNQSSTNALSYEFIVDGDFKAYKVDVSSVIYGKNTAETDASCSTITDWKKDSETVNIPGFPMSKDVKGENILRDLAASEGVKQGMCYKIFTNFEIRTPSTTFSRDYSGPITAVTKVSGSAHVTAQNIERGKTSSISINISGIRDIKGKLVLTAEASDSYSIYSCNSVDNKISFERDLNTDPVELKINGSGHYEMETPKMFSKACNRIKVAWYSNEDSLTAETFYSNNFLVGVNSFVARQVFGDSDYEKRILRNILITFGGSIILIVGLVVFEAYREHRKSLSLKY